MFFLLIYYKLCAETDSKKQSYKLNLLKINMGAIITTFFRSLIPILAGIGVGKALDKVAADKIPSYPTEGVHESGFNWQKLAWLAVTMAVGAVLVKIIGRKLNVKLLK